MSGTTINGTVAGQSTTNELTITPFSNVTIADANPAAQNEALTVTLSDMTAGSLSSSTGNGAYSNGTYTDAGSVAAVNADLQGLIFTPTAGTPGTSVTTTFTISDSNGIDVPATDSVTTVTNIDGPVISGTAANQAVTEQTTVMPFYNVVIADQSGQLETVTVTLSDAAAGSLSNLGGGSYDAQTGVYTGFGSTAAVTTDLAGLVFTPAAGQIGTTTFTIGDTDTAAATATDSLTSVVTTVGLTITNTIANQMVTDQATINPFANVIISDTTGLSEAVSITLSDPTHGTLSHLGSGTYDPQTGIFTDTGSAATITTDLEGLVFTPTTGMPGTSVTTTFTIGDTNAAETSVSDSTTSVITTSGPAISGAIADQMTTDQGTIMPFSNVTITDDAGQMETVTVTLSDPSNGTLSNVGGGSYDATSGAYTDFGSVSTVTADLDGLLFTPATGTPGQSVITTFTISDTDTAAVSATDSATSVITSSGPMISGSVGGQMVANQGTIAPFALVSVTDDAGQIETVTITLSETANGTLSNVGGFVYDEISGTYTDTGVASAVTADLDGLVFTPTAGTPGHSVTTVFTISDIDTAAVTATDSNTSVVVTAGPTISGAVADQTMTDQMTKTPLANVVVADITGQTETVIVTLTNPASGGLGNLGGFNYDQTSGAYVDSGDAATVSADLEGLVFTPTEGVPGQSVTTVFTISDTDGAAASTTDSTTSVITSAGPTITGTVADQAVSDQMTIAPFANVVISDDSGQTETVTVTMSSAADGSLDNLGGFTATDTPGVYTETASASVVTADLNGLRFTPTEGVPGQSVTTVFSLSDTDTADVTVADNTASVITSAGPLISHTVAGQSASANTTIAPFANVVITDDAGQTETVTVTLSNPANGSLSNVGGGSYDATSGVYSDTGSASTVTNDLQGLVFTPAAGTPGLSVSSVFMISDTDTGGVTVSDGTTSVVTSAGPMISGTAADQTATNQTPIMPFSGVEITDDPEQTETVTVSLSNAANGSLSNLGGFTAGDTPGTYTDTGSATAVTADLEGLVFTPAAGTPGQTVTTVFTIDDTDSGTGHATDTTTSVITLGGPTITGTVAGQTVGDQATIAPFANVTVTDDSSQTETVTVTLSTATNGALSNLNGGTYDPSTGIYTDMGTAAAVTTALDNLVFTPTVNSGTVTTSFTIAVTDTAEVTASDTTTTVVVSGVSITTIEAHGVTALLQVGNQFEMNPVAGGTGVTLSYGGSPALVTGFGGWLPIAAEQTSTGYEVAWKKPGADKYIVWNTNSSGNFTENATPVVSGSSLTLEALEPSFRQDLNGDNQTGPTTTTIEADGVTTLLQVDNEFKMQPVAGGTAVILNYQGSPALASGFGGWLPIAAEATSTGYEVAWHKPGTANYIIWNTDSSGNFTNYATSVVIGTSLVLEQMELSFQQDLNGDDQIGPTTTTIEADGVTKLLQVDNEFQMKPVAGGAAVTLGYGGSAALSTGFGGWLPIAAEATSTGFEIVWKKPGTANYIVWNTNSSGAFTTYATPVVTGTSSVLENLEVSFNQDLNGDDQIGPPPITIEADGVTKLLQVYNEFQMMPVAGGAAVTLSYGSSPALSTGFGGWMPIAAERTSTGFEVAWHKPGTTNYIVWNTDADGTFTTDATSVVSGTSLTLEQLEVSFAQDLNGDGQIGPITTTIEANGVTSLLQVGNEFQMQPVGGGTPVTLNYGGSPALTTGFGGWMPIAAEATSSGYEVAWQKPGTTSYVVWNTDTNGNFTGYATSVVSGNSLALEQLEPSFQQDLNGDGHTGVVTTTIEADGTTKLVQVDNQFEMNPVAGGAGVALSYDGSPALAGGFGGFNPIGADTSLNGYQVAWKLAGADKYIVWNTNSAGAFTGDATAVVSGESFSLEDLEPTFQQDLNGDGKVSAVLVTSTTDGAVDLTSSTQATTVNLGANSASASSGLTAPNLTFMGTPDAITLGSVAATIEYSLASTSGIETITNFSLGLDELNIGLAGAANGVLQMHDTMVDGVSAIAIDSSADHLHGVVLLDSSGIGTAANLLANHVTFAGGHALVN